MNPVLLKKLNYNPMKEYFLGIVNQLGGPNLPGSSWHYVARLLKQEYDMEVRFPFQLKLKYQMLTKPDIAFEISEMATLLESYIEANYDIRLAFSKFQQKSSNCEKFVSHRQFKTTQKIMLTIQIYMKKIISIFGIKKTDQITKLKKIQYSTYHRFFLTQLHSDEMLSDDEKVVKKYSTLFTELLTVVSNNFIEEKCELYQILVTMINRKSLSYIIEYLQYFQQLKYIHLKKYYQDSQLGLHPFLKPTLQENQEDGVYVKFITNDWESKREMYNNFLFDKEYNEKVVVHFNRKQDTYKINSNPQALNSRRKKPEYKAKSSQQIIQKRRQIRLPEDQIRQSFMTKQFNYEDELENTLEQEYLLQFNQTSQQQQQQQAINTYNITEQDILKKYYNGESQNQENFKIQFQINTSDQQKQYHSYKIIEVKDPNRKLIKMINQEQIKMGDLWTKNNIL